MIFYDLAQTVTTGSLPLMRMMVPLAIVVAIAGVLLGILSIYRRRVHNDQFGIARDFSLGDLRTLHREGKLTDEEFERAKAKLVATVQRNLKKDVKPGLRGKPVETEVKPEVDQV